MDYYIKIMPKYNISLVSKYSFDRMDKTKILRHEYITRDSSGDLYKHDGYVRCFYGENKLRYVVYKNIPQFNDKKASFETLHEACNFINSIHELEEGF